jgi:hypothetical protein
MGKSEVFGENLSQCQWVHERFQLERPGIESWSCYNGTCKSYKKTNFLFTVILRNLIYFTQ